MAKKQPIKQVKKRNPHIKSKSKKNAVKKKYRILYFLGKITIVSFLFGCIFFMMVFFGILGPVPSKPELKLINNPVASEVFSVEGKILGRYYLENRSNTGFDQISKAVIDALVATEDARFYEHRGIDEIALLRVFVKSILMRNKSAGGGSTLSQQIAKNLFPRVNYGPLSIPVNKLREAIIAYRLEKIYSKQEVLALYLNTVPFAENIFGIEVASERFFSKKAARLDIHEAAVLVGMLKANNYYNPRTHPKRALARRNVVINQMVKYNYLDAPKATIYKAKPLGVKYRVISYNQGPAPYLLAKLKPRLIEWCGDNIKEDGDPYNLYTDGLKIKTTLEYNLQTYAQQSVKEYMKRLQPFFESRWKSRDIFKERPGILKSAIAKQSDYAGLMDKGLSNQEIFVEYKKTKPTTLFTWDGLTEKNISRLDSLKYYLKMLNTGFIALEPQTGALKAWVGGIDYRFFQFDHVTSPRQTGSTFKPFVYLAALEEGIGADTYFENYHKIYEEYKDWAPRNSHDDYGGYYTMEGALAKSLNTVSVEVLLEAGISNTIDMVKDLGISADLPDYPSLALGVASISLQEVMEAYAAIVNDGKPVKTHYLLEIADRNGLVLETFKYEQEVIPEVDPENCRALLKMMESVVDYGTGKGIRTVYKVKGDFAGKTGTTQDNSDGWFVGLTPELVTGCWVGADDPRVAFRSTTYGQGAYMALPIVGKFFNKMQKDPKYVHLVNSKFAKPGPEILAQLKLPGYKEVLETKKKEFNLAKIFGKKDKSAELSDVSQEEVSKSKKNRKPIWVKIKEIFKKKDKK